MIMNLVIVESPTKARTLTKFLGEGYAVEATMGHIRDLPEKKVGIKIDGDKFTPEYVQTERQKTNMAAIQRMSGSADQVYLATDPDREGEAIAWHVAQSIRAGEGKSVSRIVFHEITQQAIEEALKHPRGIDMPLVEAQQARRVLDRLVGYKLSPLLWKKVRRGLSAGRVQSVAVRLVVEREREIEAFKPEEYWDIWVELETQNSKIKNQNHNSKFKTKLIDKVTDRDGAERVERDLRVAEYGVVGVERKEFSRAPPAPFTTSTLQQAAANKLGWTAKRTMQVAQSLYEEGNITYHRTDSTNLSEEAVDKVKRLISDRFGKNYALEKPRVYRTKSKVAQEAHEAIRPTSVQTLASSVQANRDQQRLYEMIWRRFVACQMAEAAGVSVAVTVTGRNDNEYKLQAKGETITFDGWYKIERESVRVEEQERLPEVAEGEKLEFVDLTKEQKFTEAKARYNDASLIKALEEMGIGRPSTYAPTLSTIQDRQYVERIESKRFKPTPLGLAVNDFLVANFPNIVDYEFTANMEYGLDEVANGEKKWEPVVAEFYGPFEQTLRDVADTAVRVKVEVEKTGEKCPECSEGEV
ncbi:type I DNA topoisomerase, partial [Candidatus Amesbacteria bacterium]|nr:type I DNA topoisomerase [Candidatus Amesbacteria bacterium]